MRDTRSNVQNSKFNGFTLIELLIVIAIIILLLIFVLINFQSQTARANDAKRKSDLYILHNVIEEYNTDHGVYPPQGTIYNCGSNALVPYLNQVPCDPTTQKPYGYFISSTTGGYRVCTILADTTDPAIASIGCGGPQGCGLTGGYNYCLAQGVTASAVGTVDQGATGGYPTPTPIINGGAGSVGGAWACSPIDQFGNRFCRFYEHPALAGCTVTYPKAGCNDDCFSDSAIRCLQ